VGAPIEVVHGLRAGLAIFTQRRDDIVRVAYAPALRPELAQLTQWTTSRRLPCVVMTDRELDRFAQSTHHEGLCVVTRPRRWLSTGDLADTLVHARGIALALDRVRNPYNVGAMMRTAAFFGLDAVLLGAPAPHPGLAPTAVRVAEGGAEHLRLARTTDLADTLARLRARGVCVVGADARASASSNTFAFRRPTILVMGNERAGLGDRVRAQCDSLVALIGGGALESLNVSVATGIFLARMVGSSADVGTRSSKTRSSKGA
jgi:TrmH RNA methyltransferase